MKYHFECYPNSTIQIANYLNSSMEDCAIDKKKTIQLKKLTESKQLVLDVEELITITK